MYVYQIVYPKGLELVQPSECVPNLSCHRGDPVWYYRQLLIHNNDTIKCKKKKQMEERKKQEKKMIRLQVSHQLSYLGISLLLGFLISWENFKFFKVSLINVMWWQLFELVFLSSCWQTVYFHSQLSFVTKLDFFLGHLIPFQTVLEEESLLNQPSQLDTV